MRSYFPFLVFIVLSFMDVIFAWRFLGFYCVVWGCYVLVKKEVKFGIEGKRPIFHLTKKYAFVIGLLIILLGLLLLLNPELLLSSFKLCRDLCEEA